MTGNTMSKKRAQCYAALATALKAGLGIDRSLRVAADDGSGPFSRAAERIIINVKDGQTLAQAMAAHPKLFPPVDIILIEIGEETGALEAAFEHLADWYEFKRRIWRTLISGMVYPTLVIHVAALIIPGLQLFLQEISFAGFIATVLLILACFYVPIIGGLLAYRWFSAKPGGRRPMDELMLKIPVLGKALRDLALSRYCRNFLAMYMAGAQADKCNAAAVKMCGNAAVAAWFKPGTQLARDGHEISSGFSRNVPNDFTSLWMTAEEAGRLDDTLKRLADKYAEDAESSFQQLASWLPRIIYACIAVFIIFTIFRLAMGYVAKLVLMQ